MSIGYMSIGIIVLALIIFISQKNHSKIAAKRNQDDEESFIKGYRFFAALKLETPLYILEKHGEIISGNPSNLPNYCDNSLGGWVPESKSWEELAREAGGDTAFARKFDKAMPESTMASSVGPIPRSGGDYLDFLKDFRRIVESVDSIESQIKKLNDLAKKNEEYSYFAKMQGDAELGTIWFSRIFKEIPGITNKASTLVTAGYRTLDDLANASDEELIQLKGFGPSTVAKIRDYLTTRGIDTGRKSSV